MATKRFRFSLEALLRVRRLRERQALGPLAKVLAAYNVHQKEIINKGQEIQKAMQDYGEQSQQSEMPAESKNIQNTATLEKKQIWDRYFERLDAQIEAAQNKALLLHPELEREQSRVQAARRERKVLELLKEKEKAEYVRKMQKKERRELAELNQRSKSFDKFHALKSQTHSYLYLNENFKT